MIKRRATPEIPHEIIDAVKGSETMCGKEWITLANRRERCLARR
jgi:hypothetical protein